MHIYFTKYYLKMLHSVTQWFVANLWLDFFFYAKHYCMRLHVPPTPLIHDSVSPVPPLSLRRERLKFCCWCVWCLLVLICHSLTRCLFSLPFCWSQRRSPVSVPLPPPPWVSAHMSHAFCCLSLLSHLAFGLSRPNGTANTGFSCRGDGRINLELCSPAN